MIPKEIPYFLNNRSWYYYDEEEGIYKLTKEASEKAIESYTEFYKLLDSTLTE